MSPKKAIPAKRRGRPSKKLGSVLSASVLPSSGKRRGRPAKVKSIESVLAAAPKRRGRPAKVKSIESVLAAATPKRRGRPSKKVQVAVESMPVVSQKEPAYKTGTPGSYEGLQMLVPGMATPSIETWEFQYPGSNTDLTIEIPEFTCVCPKTGLPDFATIIIQYTPNKQCIELKSLKEYVLFYRNLGIFHEHVVNRMLQDISKSCKPKKMTITGVFNARGGIQTTVQATL